MSVIKVALKSVQHVVHFCKPGFFQSQSGIYAAFVEQEGPTHITLRGLGGEEIAVGVATVNGATEVNASSYMFDQQIAFFLSSLPPVAQGAAR